MSQMKELKELTLLVKQRMIKTKWQGCVSIHHLPFCFNVTAPHLVFNT